MIRFAVLLALLALAGCTAPNRSSPANPTLPRYVVLVVDPVRDLAGERHAQVEADIAAQARAALFDRGYSLLVSPANLRSSAVPAPALDASAYTDADLLEFGRASGAEAVVAFTLTGASFDRLPNSPRVPTTMSVRILGVADRRVLWTASAEEPTYRLALDDEREAISHMAHELAESIPSER